MPVSERVQSYHGDEPMTLERAREIVRLAAKGWPHDEDVPTGAILRALCVLVEKIDRG